MEAQKARENRSAHGAWGGGVYAIRGRRKEKSDASLRGGLDTIARQPRGFLGQNFEKGHYDFGVELRARTPIQARPWRDRAAGRGGRDVRCHGVVGIHHRYDSREEWNFFSMKSLRIAAAIVGFLMM